MATLLKIVGCALILGGFSFGTWNWTQTNLWSLMLIPSVCGFVSGVLFYGIGEIVLLLQKISSSQDMIPIEIARQMSVFFAPTPKDNCKID